METALTTSPTLQDIADSLGVSKGTVSLALNDQPGVKEDTRQRVKEYARLVNYRPNTLARAFGRGKSQMVAVILARLNDSFFEEIVQGIENIASHQGYDVLVSSTWARGQSATDLIDRLLSRRIDGFIGGSLSLPPEARQRFREAGVPQLFLGPEPVEDYPTVMVDNTAGAQMAAAYLHELGHRRLLFLGTQDRHSALRAQAAEAALNERGDGTRLEVRLTEGLHDREVAYYAIATRLRARRDFTAVLCASDVLAVGACNALEDAGVSVPSDVSVVGYDDLRWTKLVRPALTTVHQPHVSQGEAAMRALLDLIEGRGTQNQYLMPRLVVRDSTAPAPPTALKL